MVDRARLGSCRLGFTRLGVDTDHWQRFVDGLENIEPKSMGGIDPAVWDHCRWDYFRWDVKLPLFDAFKEGLEKHG